MEATQNPFVALGQRVREGDFQAKMQLEQDLGPAITRRVRHVLRQRKATDTFGRHVLRMAKRLPPWLRRASRKRQVAALASAMCQLVVNSEWPGRTVELCQATLSA